MSGLEDDENVALGMEDEDVELMKQQVKELEEEKLKLKEIQSDVKQQMGAQQQTPIDKADIDSRSIYVGSVDYGSTPEELQDHFKACGTINRVTIMCDKFSGQPKGFAYIEFAETDSVVNAMVLNDSLFRGRQLKVTAKRTNVPGLAARGRGRGRGGMGAMMNNPMAAMMAMMAGGGMGGRFRGAPRFRNRRAQYRPY